MAPLALNVPYTKPELKPEEGTKQDAGLYIQDPEPAEEEENHTVAFFKKLGGWWLMLAVALLIASVVLFTTDHLREGWALLGAGAVASGITLYKVWKHSK